MTGSPSRCTSCGSSCGSFRWPSELQATLASAVGQGRHATVVLVAGAVEDHALDAGGLGPLGDQAADQLGLVGLVTRLGPQVALHRGGLDQRLAEGVVDHLGTDVLGRPGDHQARALGRAGHVLAAADLPAQPGPDARRGVLVLLERDRHGHLPAFPTLRRTCSPAYRTPLPLYDSGLLSLRMLAATSPTSCLSMPWTPKRVWFSTAKVMPSGALKMIGWL